MLTVPYNLFFNAGPVKADTGPPNDVNIMFTTDWQNAGSPAADMNSGCDIDILFHLGDEVNAPWNQGEWDTFHSNWDSVTGTGTILYRNYLHGNHEGYYATLPCAGGGQWDGPDTPAWMNRSRLCPTYEAWMGNFYDYCNNTKIGNYTYTYGNVLFIVLGTDFRDCLNGQDVFSCMKWLDWCNETIQANQDMNIVILCHFGIETGTQDYYDGLWEQDEYYWIMDNYNVFAWIHGHTHRAPSVTNLHGTYHVNAGKGAGGGDDSVMFYFVNGSSTVDIKQRNHDVHTWTDTISGFDTLTLDFAFDASWEREATTSQFISIDDGTNGTTIYNSTPTINWTVIADTSQYWLQIDNNADFSSPEINITDINQWNYPSNCDINATRVSFTLPNALTSYDKYYMRVKAFTRN